MSQATEKGKAAERQPKTRTRESEADHEAAQRIQRVWRKSNAAKEQYLTSDTRWQDAFTNTKAQAMEAGADEGHNAPRDRWRRAAFRFSQLQDGDKMLAGATDIKDDDAARKQLETQHWLELIDGKHRYGSNLKYYHKRWQQEDTEENFFKWLDRGGGKNVSLKECPREQLEKETIFYFSPEQRLNYLVKIDSEGKLRWARNDELVDTTAGRWKDAGNGQGIVPDDADTSAQTDGAASSSSSEASDAAQHYVGPTKGKTKITRTLRKHLTIHGIVDKLMKKTVRRNTWIYVSDKNWNLFVGIKVPGQFQHSTFLAGGLVTSAGLITVHEGMIHTLSPLSGHYRTSISHFRKFMKILEQRGVDTEKIEVSKAEAALWLIEHFGKFKKRQSDFFSKGKTKAKEVAVDTKLVPKSNWKREVVEGRKKKQAEAKDGDKSDDAPPNSSIEKPPTSPQIGLDKSSTGGHGEHQGESSEVKHGVSNSSSNPQEVKAQGGADTEKEKVEGESSESEQAPQVRPHEVDGQANGVEDVRKTDVGDVEKPPVV